MAPGCWICSHLVSTWCCSNLANPAWLWVSIPEVQIGIGTEGGLDKPTSAKPLFSLIALVLIFGIRSQTYCICWELRLDQETYYNRVNREMTRCDERHTWRGAGLASAPAPDLMWARYWGLAGYGSDVGQIAATIYPLTAPCPLPLIQPEVCATKHEMPLLVYHIVSLLIFKKTKTT